MGDHEEYTTSVEQSLRSGDVAGDGLAAGQHEGLHAAMLSERRLRAVLSDSDERMLFAGLCEQAGAPVTPAAVARVERLRARRHERDETKEQHP